MKTIFNQRALTHLVALAFFTSVTLNIAACGGGTGANSGLNGATGSGSSKLDQDWQAIDMKAFVAGGPYNNHQVISIDKVTKTLTVEIPLTGYDLGATITVPVTEIPGAVVSIAQDSAGQWAFQFTMPLSHLLKGINYNGPKTLPNGQPLPAIPGGQLPQISAHVTSNGGKTNFYVYGSEKYFAIFFPTPKFNPFISLSWPIQNASKTKILGYLNTVPDSGSAVHDGGLYFAMVFPVELQRLLDDLLN